MTSQGPHVGHPVVIHEGTADASARGDRQAPDFPATPSMAKDYAEERT
jgi:hypothetical protein